MRKEYSVYPDFMYKKGRTEVLQQFLSMQSIFKTDHFYHLREEKAKENIHQELALL